MIELQFPEPRFRMRQEGEQRQIFDSLRKRWLVLTEEEWVRQNLVQYLIQVAHYPAASIALEKEIWIADVKKRFDILVYDASSGPWLLIECKAPSVPLKPDVLEQLLRYNLRLPVPYLLISNGRHSLCWKRGESGLVSLSQLPAWNPSAGFPPDEKD